MKQNRASSINRRFARNIFIIDGLFIVLSTLIILENDRQLLKPVLLAYLAYIIPTIYFYYKMLKSSVLNNLDKVVGSLYAAEIGKFILTISFFIMAILLLKNAVEAIPVFFAAYVVLLIVHQLVVFLVNKWQLKIIR